jgi:hypothetical protein
MKPNPNSQTLGEILGRTFAIYRSRFWTFVAIAALPTVAMIGFLVGVTHWVFLYSANHQPIGVFSACLVWLGSFFMAAFLGMMVMPLFIKVASAAVSGGRSTVIEALRHTMPHWRTCFRIVIQKLSFTMLAPTIAVMFLLLAEVIIANAVGAPRILSPREWIPVVGLPTIVGFCLFLWTGAGLSLAIPAAILDGAKGGQALRRSWRLAESSRFRILSVWLSVFTSFWIACIVLQILLGQMLYRLGSALHFQKVAENLYNTAAMPMYAGVSSLLVPIYPIAITLLYYDQRVQEERFQVESTPDEAAQDVFADSNPEATGGKAAQRELDA